MSTIDDVQLRRVPARLARIGRQALDAGRELDWRTHGEPGVRANGVPAVRQGRRPSQGTWAFTNDPYRWVWLLHRLGQKVDIREATILSLKGWMITRPQLFEGAQIFIRDCTTLGKRRQAERLKLFTHPAHTDADDEPTFGEHVKGSQDFSSDERGAMRHDDDTGHEPDRVRLSSQEGQHCELFHGFTRRRAGERAICS